MIWRIALTPTAKATVQAISDRRVREKVGERIRQLATDPQKQGNPLVGELAGYRSVRAVGQRYRIVYRVEDERVLVLVVAVDIRKERSRDDVYALARRLLRLRLLEPP